MLLGNAGAHSFAEHPSMTLQASSASASISKAIAMICLSTFLPAAPETVAAYLAAHAGTSKASTLGRRVAAIGYAHKLARLETPTDTEGVKATMRASAGPLWQRQGTQGARGGRQDAGHGRGGAGKPCGAAGSRVALDWLRWCPSPLGVGRGRYLRNRDRPVSHHPGKQDRSG